MIPANARAVYSPSRNVVIDLVAPNVTAEAAVAKYAAEYGTDLVVLPIDEALWRYEDKFRRPVEEINEETWWYMLEVLPPHQWSHQGGGESFHLGELIAGRIANIYVRIGKRFFRFSDDARLSPQSRVERVEAYLLEKAWSAKEAQAS
jgi:hypothetical protein